MPPDALRGREVLVPSAGRALDDREVLDLPAGRALDVACGRGATAVWLALRGLAVDAVDVSAVGLATGAALASRFGVGDRLRWWAHDLDSGLPVGCTGPYEVVVCQRFRDPALYALLAELLADGGLLVLTVLSEVGGEPGPFRARPGELLTAFGGLEVIAHEEGAGEASLVARHGRRVIDRCGT